MNARIANAGTSRVGQLTQPDISLALPREGRVWEPDPTGIRQQVCFHKPSPPRASKRIGDKRHQMCPNRRVPPQDYGISRVL